MGAEGKLDAGAERNVPCAALYTGKTSASKIGNTLFIRCKCFLPIPAIVSLTLEPQSAGRDIRANRQPAQ